VGVDPDHEHDNDDEDPDVDDEQLFYPNELARRAAKSAGLKPHRAAPPSAPPS
jgi:hypothetical protein